MKKTIMALALALLMMAGATAQEVTLNEGVQINQNSNIEFNSTSQLQVSNIKAFQGSTQFDTSNFSIDQELTDQILVELDKYNISESTPQESFNYTINASNGNNLSITHSNLGAEKLYSVDKDGTQIFRKKTDNQGVLLYYSDDWSRSRILVFNQSEFKENPDQEVEQDSQPGVQVIYSTDAQQESETESTADADINFQSFIQELIDLTAVFSDKATPNIQSVTVLNEQGQAITEAPEGETVTIRAEVTDADGRNNLSQAVINLTDPNGNLEVSNQQMTDEGDIPNGNIYEFDYTLPTTVNDAGEWQIDVKAKDSQGNTAQRQASFIHQYIIKNEQDPEQDGDATIFDDIPFTETVLYENPSDGQYTSVDVEINVPTSIVASSTVLQNENGNSISHTVNKSGGKVYFTIPSINAGETREYELDYEVEGPNVSTATFNTIDATGRNSTVQQFNLTAQGGQTYPDLQAETTFSDPANIVTYTLMLNGTDVTTEQEYNFDTSDQDGDGSEETVEWTVPSLSGRQDYEVQALRGFPLQVERDDVITNKPVTDTKNIEWRSGFRFQNRNPFSIDVNYKARLPLRASDIILGNRLIEKRFDNQGAYIPIEFTLSGNSNRTRFVEYTTSTISITENDFQPDVHWINKPTTSTVNVTYINDLPQTVRDAEARIQILQGNDLTTTLENGTVIDERDVVEGSYTFSISEVPGNSERVATVEYDVPVATSDYQGKRNISNGNTISVWSVSSESPVARQNTQFLASNISCIEAQRAYTLENNETQEIKCRDQETVVNVGTLGPNQNFELGIEHREYNVVVESSIRLYRALAANALLASSVLIIFLIVASGGLYIWKRDDIPFLGEGES